MKIQNENYGRYAAIFTFQQQLGVDRDGYNGKMNPFIEIIEGSSMRKTKKLNLVIFLFIIASHFYRGLQYSN